MTRLTPIRPVDVGEWVDVWLPAIELPQDRDPTVRKLWDVAYPREVPFDAILSREIGPGEKRAGSPTLGDPLGGVMCLTVHPDYVRHFTARIPAEDVPLEARLLRRCLLAGYPPREQDQDAIADRLRAEAARVPMDERRKAMMARTLHQLMLRGLPADRTLEIAREVGADTADADGPVDTDLRGL